MCSDLTNAAFQSQDQRQGEPPVYSRHTSALRKAEQESTQLPVIAQAHRNVHRDRLRANLHRWERGHPEDRAA